MTLRPAVLIGALCFLGAGCEPSVPKSGVPTSSPQQAPIRDAAKSETGRLIITGVVTDSASGKPLPGAQVFSTAGGYVFADVNGHYRFDIPYHIPTYGSTDFTVTAGMKYYELSKGRTEPFLPERERVFNFSLVPDLPQPGFTLVSPEARYIPGEGAVSVRVIDAKSGDPVPGVTVLVKYSSQGGKTGADGMMRFKGIDPRYPSNHRVSLLLDYGPNNQFPEAKNEYVIHFVPGYMTDITLSITPK